MADEVDYIARERPVEALGQLWGNTTCRDWPRSRSLGQPNSRSHAGARQTGRDGPRLKVGLKIGVALGPCGFKSRPRHRSAKSKTGAGAESPSFSRRFRALAQRMVNMRADSLGVRC